MQEFTRNGYRGALGIAAGACLGYIAWAGYWQTMICLPAVIFLWAKCSNRLTAFLSLFAYYLVASRGLIHGAPLFFSDLGSIAATIKGIMLWIAASGLLALVWAAFWGRKALVLRFLATLLMLTIPPVGFFGAFTPIQCAGVFFPGMGWLGMCLTIWLLSSFTKCPQRFPILFLLTVSCGANILYKLPTANSWVAIDTSIGTPKTVDDEFSNLQRLQHILLASSKASPISTHFLMPELIGGDWDINQIWWEKIDAQLKRKNQTAFIGSYRTTSMEGNYQNVLISIGAHDGKVLVDRIPVPVAMWHPWKEKSAVAYPFSSSVVQVGSYRITSLICYEQLLSWPVLMSMTNSPQVVLAPSNSWWSKDTSMPAIQKQSATAWARLIGVPLIWANNI